MSHPYKLTVPSVPLSKSGLNSYQDKISCTTVYPGKSVDFTSTGWSIGTMVFNTDHIEIAGHGNYEVCFTFYTMYPSFPLTFEIADYDTGEILVQCTHESSWVLTWHQSGGPRKVQVRLSATSGVSIDLDSSSSRYGYEVGSIICAEESFEPSITLDLPETGITKKDVESVVSEAMEEVNDEFEVTRIERDALAARLSRAEALIEQMSRKIKKLEKKDESD